MTTSLFIALLLAIEPPADPASPVVTTSESPVAVASPTSTTEVVSTTATPDAVVTTTSTGDTVVVVQEAPGASPAPAVAPAAPRQPIVEPLPAPPEPVRAPKFRRGPWRGRVWLGIRAGLTGPLGGERPARSAAVAFGAGVDLGWRVNNWLGLGTGLSGQIHDAQYVTELTPLGPERKLYYGNMLNWDVAFARLFLPLRRRFQPFAELGGGMASYERPTGGYILGGQVRYGVGFDGWVGEKVTLGVIANGRTTRLDQKFADGSVKHPVGTSYQILAELGFHW